MATTIQAANTASSETYTSVVTNITIPSIYNTCQDKTSKDFLTTESLSTLRFNYKNHYRTEQIVDLANECPINLSWLLEPTDAYTGGTLKNEYNSPVELSVSESSTTTSYPSPSPPQVLYQVSSLKTTSQEGFIESKDTSQLIRNKIKTKSASLAPHVFEYFAYLPFVATSHVLGDIASTSPYWWYAIQVATLVLITDAITEHNLVGRSVPYGAIAQAVLADALFELKGFEDVFQAITSFALTTMQSIPSVIDNKFWRYESDLEHSIDQILGSEQNAAMCLLRGIFLKFPDPFTLTVVTCPQIVETS
ncbi:hypothetical protein EMPS_01906 [Entomortierella parvispora]|uniref:Uncharacterized protein n=1 Tax=Entomortierella parvispora TaxID=205924 RepID=A0A9P3H3V0_9FUNG|nr:hypothetical protein EMPS_01906 [Entomortierella parvispora]